MKKVTFITKTQQLGLAAITGLALFGTQTFAADSSSAQFLKLGAGARAAGMADAFSSVADDVTAAYWNPAGLAQVEKAQVSVMQNQSLVETQYQYFGGAMPLKNQTVAFSLYRMDYGTIDRYSATDEKTGNFDAGSMAAALSLGKIMNDKMSWGATLKFIQESIEAEKATTFAGDLGFMVRHGETNFGFSMQHLGAGLKFIQEKGSLPLTFRAGASRRFFEESLLGALEVSKANDNDATIHGGIEYKVNQVLQLRGGYQMTPGNSLDVAGLTGITAGLGLNINKFSVDYGFIPFGDLGSSHKVSLLVHFN